MNRHQRSLVLLGLVASGGLAAQALAQRPPVIRTPRNLPGLLTSSSGGTAIPVQTGSSQFPSTIPPPPPPASPFQPGTPGSAHPVTGPMPSELMGAKTPGGAVQVNFSDVDLPDLLQWISGITGRRFIYGAKVRSIKVTLYSPHPVSVDEAYKVFLVALDTNGLTVIPHGRFLKIIETTGGVHGHVTPVYGAGQPVPAEERYVTRIYRLHHIGADEATGILNTFKSKEANVTPYAPGGLVIITDTGANIRRLLRIVEEIDVGTAGEQIFVEPVHYGTATEFVQRLNEIFDIKPAAAGAAKGPTTGDMRITKIIADDRSNSLIIVATERSYLRILEVIKRLDVPITGEGEIHVLPLQHAMAEELAPVLNQIIGGTSAPKTAKPAPGASGQAPSVLEGGAKITADKATNSLIITASLRDYAQIRTVIDRLDQPRRQVFIEAVIMDLSVDHSNKLGLGYHAGGAPKLIGSDPSLVYGGFNPLQSIGLPNDPSQLQGLALGVRGPAIDGTSNLLGTGITIPAFGIVLNALATTGDANVLATPHIIATDNVPAEINVGENIPLQTNLGGSLPTGMLGAQGAAATGALGALGGFGGFGFGAAPRQDVGTKIKVTPHMNDSNEVRLELQEEISERGASSGALGVVSITKRTANTSVVVQDQQTVVIGGLMRDAYTSSKRKIPILGDIPLLGALFRSTETAKRKTNLLLVLTPYVIRDQNDLRTVFERKMQERQEFLDRYFVFSDQTTYEPPRDFSRLNGLLEDIRQAYRALDEKKRLVETTRPKDKKTHEPREPLAMPEIHRAPAAAPAGGPAVPTSPVAPTGSRPPRIGSPSVLSAGAKAVGATPAPPPPPPAPAKKE
ncbi:MAG: type II secretion system secretin GspD [Polyangiaceae bacterium]|nr:type II secretion system secretin GspD [Polyangiaceae bacterium]